MLSQEYFRVYALPNGNQIGISKNKDFRYVGRMWLTHTPMISSALFDRKECAQILWQNRKNLKLLNKKAA